MRKPDRIALAVVVVTALCAVAALAADKPYEVRPGKRRVLVADAVPNGVEASLAKTLTSMLVARLDARPGIDALSGSELKQLMALQADKAACGSEECINDLTGALGAPLAVFADVGKLGTLTVVNLTLFDVVKGEPVARADVNAEKLEELPTKLDAAVDTLLANAPKTEVVASAPPSLQPPPAKEERSQPPPKTSTTTSAKKAAADSKPSPAPPAPAGGGGELADLLGDGGGSAGGGLGMSGSGVGGAGANLGGGGLGSIGSVGHGGGYGAGAESSSSLSPSDVRSVVASHRGELVGCGRLAKAAHKAGVVKVRFLIAGDGKVTFANITDNAFAGTGVGRCVINQVGSWTFKATGSPTTIAYPFRFD